MRKVSDLQAGLGTGAVEFGYFLPYTKVLSRLNAGVSLESQLSESVEWNVKLQTLLLPPEDCSTLIAQRGILPVKLVEASGDACKKFIETTAKFLYNYLREHGLTLNPE